ncbi:RTA1-domain-containing protein [Peniophora sp. CONT]|nr:RTA1-domain-containing protein [Peniophora sp. CONT]
MSQYNITNLPPGVTIDDISPYGYVPTRAISFLFLSLFGLSTATHLAQAVYFRLWFLLPTVVLCGVGELVGWSGRLWSSYNIQNDNAFLMQITTTIISPTPLIAANFIMLGRIILRLGEGYSRVNQRWYTRIFLSCDIIALIIQGAGGGIASSANDKAGTDLGANVMLAGIIFQLVCIIVYTALAAEFLWHYVKDRPFRRAFVYEHRSQTPMRLKVMLLGMGIMTVLLFIRSIYRTAELADGWDGIIINTEWPFDLFDGAMITIAMISLNVIHPGWFLVPEELTAEGALKTEPKSSAVSSETMLEYRGTPATNV